MTRDLFPFVVLDSAIERLKLRANTDPKFASTREKLISVLQTLHKKIGDKMRSSEPDESREQLHKLFDEGCSVDRARMIFIAVLILACQKTLEEA